MTAGLDAGLIYNETFPKMGDQWIPDDLQQYDPAWLGILKTHGGVQFAHRWLAILTVILTLGFWAHAQKKNNLRSSINYLAIMALVQTGLGLATLLSKVSLPIAVGV